jgi:hypothetical protein
MKKSTKGSLSGAIIATVFLFSFQNCGPAKLSGDSGDSTGMTLGSTIGNKIDLAALLSVAQQESAANVLFPSSSSLNTYDYSEDCPIIENIILLNNEFTQIEWIHGPSQSVVANGDSFNQSKYSADADGDYYVFGYRGQNPYLLAKFKIVAKGSQTLVANDPSAVQFVKGSMASDGTNEKVFLDVEAPYVDVASYQFTFSNGMPMVTGKRALLIAKKLSESVDVNVKVTDMSGQVYSKTVNFPASVSGTNPTPTPTPPAATPTPTPPSPAMEPAVTLSATSMDFGTVDFDSTSAVKFVTVTNSGNAVLNILNSVATGKFKVARQSTCGASLDPGTNCTVGVQFSPGFMSGSASGTLTITTDAPDSPHVVQLTGRGSF